MRHDPDPIHRSRQGLGRGRNLWDAVNYFIDEGARDSVIDFGLHCSLVSSDMADLETVIPRICNAGVRSFKGFMAYKRRGMYLADSDILRILSTLKDNGGLFLRSRGERRPLRLPRRPVRGRGQDRSGILRATRPDICEAEAGFRILSFGKSLDCPIYVVHISTWEALEVVKLFRQWGSAPIFAETCTHYLTLTDREMREMGSLAKVSPPLREERDIDALWAAVKDGTIDVIGADTAGHLIDTKEPRWGDVFKAPAGLPGQETMFTVTYDEGFNRRSISLCRLVELMAEKPAKIFGIYPRKGVLQAGADADVLIFDPTREARGRAVTQHTKTDYTMYEGRRCLGAPELVMQRGEVLLEDGELLVTKGRAQFLEAEPT